MLFFPNKYVKVYIFNMLYTVALKPVFCKEKCVHFPSCCLFSRPGLPTELLQSSYEDRSASGCSQVQLGFRYESRDQRFIISIIQLSNCNALFMPADQKMYELISAIMNPVLNDRTNGDPTCFLQAHPRGSAATHSGHLLPLPNTRPAPSGHGGHQ